MEYFTVEICLVEALLAEGSTFYFTNTLTKSFYAYRSQSTKRPMTWLSFLRFWDLCAQKMLSKCWRYWPLPSISSTFYSNVFCTKFWHQKLQCWNITRKSCTICFHMKNARVKRWWNWRLVSKKPDLNFGRIFDYLRNNLKPKTKVSVFFYYKRPLSKKFDAHYYFKQICSRSSGEVFEWNERIIISIQEWEDRVRDGRVSRKIQSCRQFHQR